MKRFKYLLLAVAMLICLTGCAKPYEDNPMQQEEPTPTTNNEMCCAGDDATTTPSENPNGENVDEDALTPTPNLGFNMGDVQSDDSTIFEGSPIQGEIGL